MEGLAAADPRRLGRYRTRAVLGEGGMGRVFLATGPHGSLVAIKKVHDPLAGDEEFRKRFRREVAASRRVDSPHTAPVVDADTDGDVPWLASEFVWGPSLREALDAVGRLPQDAVLRLAGGLAAALRDIHAAGLIHRDLSPSNVLLADAGPRVIDFGIVRAVEGATRRHTMTTTVTRSGMVIGAPGYMSPEQAEGRELTAASDVFSLGTTLLVAATGSNPFEGPGIPQTMYNVVHADPDLDALPRRLRTLVEPCLAKDPGRRPSPRQILTELGAVPAADRPWPDRVHRLTEGQRAEVRRRVPDSEARTTTVPPTPGPTRRATRPTPPSPALPSTPAPTPTPVRARGGGAAVGVAVLVGLLVLAWATNEDRENGSAGASASSSPTFDIDPGQGTTTEPAQEYGGDIGGGSGHEPQPEPEPDPTTPSPDPVRDATAGDCLYNQGTPHAMDLEATTCDAGALEVVRVIPASSDPDDCEGTDDADWAYTSGAHDLTLCLSYLHRGGSAFHADEGDCVYGGNDDESLWEERACETGNFQVVGRLEGDSTWDDCDSYDWQHGRHFSVAGWSELNVRLCLRMNYPDDAGYADLDTCLLKSGSDDDPTFEFADCDVSNVYVTGRTSEYSADAFCGGDAWTSWQNPDFPEYGYTVCWRWL